MMQPPTVRALAMLAVYKCRQQRHDPAATLERVATDAYEDWRDLFFLAADERLAADYEGEDTASSDGR